MTVSPSDHLTLLSRNDWAVSGQVVKAASKVVQLGLGLAHVKVGTGTSSTEL